MNKFDWWQYQRDCEDAFWLDCSEEDIKKDKEVTKVFKQLKKQRRWAQMMERLYQKMIGNDSGFLSNLLCIYRIKY